MRIRLNRGKRKPVDASESPVAALQAARNARAVQRLIAAESARAVPAEKALDGLAEISADDIEHAVSEFDQAQVEAKTGLSGLLNARVDA